jgi:ubiquilin
MMSSPQFLQQMSSIMSNPAVLDQIIASNPQLAAMGPQVREVFQSENFRQMMSDLLDTYPFISALTLSFMCFFAYDHRSNPESLRTMLQMASMFREPGSSPFGAPHAFPAPGLPSTVNPNPPASTPSNPTSPTTQQPGANAFHPLFGALAGAPAGGAAGSPPPFGLPPLSPALMQQLLGSGVGSSPALFGGGHSGAPVPPSDTRPPEERYQVQLQVRTSLAGVFCY